jgi:hypothetical protein
MNALLAAQSVLAKFNRNKAEWNNILQTFLQAERRYNHTEPYGRPYYFQAKEGCSLIQTPGGKTSCEIFDRIRLVVGCSKRGGQKLWLSQANFDQLHRLAVTVNAKFESFLRPLWDAVCVLEKFSTFEEKERFPLPDGVTIFNVKETKNTGRLYAYNSHTFPAFKFLVGRYTDMVYGVIPFENSTWISAEVFKTMYQLGTTYLKELGRLSSE